LGGRISTARPGIGPTKTFKEQYAPRQGKAKKKAKADKTLESAWSVHRSNKREYPVKGCKSVERETDENSKRVKKKKRKKLIKKDFRVKL